MHFCKITHLDNFEARWWVHSAIKRNYTISLPRKLVPRIYQQNIPLAHCNIDSHIDLDYTA